MIKKHKSQMPSKVYRAVCLALMAGGFSLGVNAAEAEAAEEDLQDIEMEETVVTGSRLQGSAQAVLGERKDQAFVADILGSEQISRTGDGDAASALRRVTGLTLVDGKFIYIRGLGERYSSTLLNAASVPSPDPTRSVLPLDLFPSSVIESLSVQKSYSPDLPAYFAGGNVNIRTKSIPNESIFKIGGKLGYNFDNEKSPWYAGGGDDSIGSDDGTRELPAAFEQAFQAGDISTLSGPESVALLGTLNRDISARAESVDPDIGFNVTFGDKIDVADESQFGFLAAVSYKNEWQVGNERNVNNLASSGGQIRINEFADGASTEHEVKWSGLLNFGYDFDANHSFEFNNIYLKDTKDRLRDRQFENTNTINEPDESRRKVDILYEERELFSNQLKGRHNFPEWYNVGVDWYYSRSETERFAPGGFETTFRLDRAGSGFTSQLARDINTTYSFQKLDDEVENWGGNVSIPFYFDDWNLELKAGVDFIDKQRNAENIGITVQTFSIPAQFLPGSDFSQIFSDGNLSQADFTVRLDDTTADGDKYIAATLNDAYYFMASAEIGAEWRVTGGLRYEDFRQVSVPFQPHSNFFSVEGEEIAELPLAEDDVFGSFAVTYSIDSEMQLRFNVSQTTIRPDFRDVSTSFYIDPLTEFLVRGSTSLQGSDIDNFDFRWEWYMETGENLSVAFFYKDITNPIEQIELPSATEGAPQLLTANASDGEVFGLEVEFLKDFSFLGDEYANFFASGNFTVSESEVNICSDNDPNTLCLFEEQLKEALNTTESVTSVITNNSRRLIGHSEWVVNLQLGWDSLDGEHAATLVYNVFGPRIIVPGVNGFEDAEELSFDSLDAVYTWYPTYDSTFKVKLKNILDEEKTIRQEGVDILRETVGTEFSVEYSHEF
ncbi:TonB-dependent receptor plug domain-containing protein [Aliikangiella marina]|nr:TonB-dependent receptor plug domain-containing protein [Aliikangiella marina]